MLEDLKQIVCEQSKRLHQLNLVIVTEGNVSHLSPDRAYIAIKPSGVRYEDLQAEMITIVDMDGRIVEGDYKPSVDLATHLEIYRSFEDIFGIAHTHSPYATIFAQQEMDIPCHGTTHADFHAGVIPVTRRLTEQEISESYEASTGSVIIECLRVHRSPAVLVRRHGPFTFGKHARGAVDNAQLLEKVAHMALTGTYESSLPENILLKHHLRKHGIHGYYGQPTSHSI